MEVPDLTSLAPDDAREKLQSQKLKLGVVTTTPAAGNQAGRVLSQNPKAGSQVAPQSVVSIVIGEKEGDNSIPLRTAAETIKLVAREPDFEKTGATEAKLLRIAEEQGLQSEDDLQKDRRHRRRRRSA